MEFEDESDLFLSLPSDPEPELAPEDVFPPVFCVSASAMSAAVAFCSSVREVMTMTYSLFVTCPMGSTTMV